MPICWQPLIELFDRYVESLHEMDHEASLKDILPIFRDLALEFSVDKNRVLGRFLLLTAFQDDLYKKITEKLDLLEENITEYCKTTISNPNSTSATEISFIESLFWTCLTEISKEMMTHHPHGRFIL